MSFAQRILPRVTRPNSIPRRRKMKAKNRNGDTSSKESVPTDNHADCDLRTKSNLAIQAGVSVRTVSRWLACDGLPFVRIGAVVRIDQAAFVAWLAKRTKRNSVPQ
jgi:excisionase family DNA binding protein